MSAVSRALDLPEILELILLSLDERRALPQTALHNDEVAGTANKAAPQDERSATGDRESPPRVDETVHLNDRYHGDEESDLNSDNGPDDDDSEDDPEVETETPDQFSWSAAIEDLFVMQRVSKTWKTTIESSVKLRRIMMLEFDLPSEPKRAFGLDYLLHPYTASLRFHPAVPCILSKIDGNFNGKEAIFFELGILDHDGEWGNGGKPTCVGCACSELEDVPVEVHRANITAADEGMFALAQASFKGYLAPEASWRQMKLCSQPTLLSITYTIGTDWKFSRDHVNNYPSLALYDTASSKTGCIFDAVERLLLRRAGEHRERAEVWRDFREQMHDVYADASAGNLDTQEFRDAKAMKHEHDQLLDCGISQGDCEYCTFFRAFGNDGGPKKKVLQAMNT